MQLSVIYWSRGEIHTVWRLVTVSHEGGAESGENQEAHLMPPLTPASGAVTSPESGVRPCHPLTLGVAYPSHQSPSINGKIPHIIQ